METPMKLDRNTARALVDANMMPLDEYIALFGSTEEKEAGKADALAVARTRPARRPAREEEEVEGSFGFPRHASRSAIIHIHCH
jgi:hypothetical protein